ncbi:hypothetical protein F4781DRAFT_396401 [Annulohypoxylon bovei var. microspora]|nr:hypothetical protein F4781DRAFT_396401 [Annulohypoxylon bovei var. microspora]
MLPQSRHFSLLAVATAAEAKLVKIAFTNGRDTHLSPDVDGPWPTIPLNYFDTDSNNGTLNVYITFSDTSLLISPQTCTENITNGTFLCGEFVYPEFYHGSQTDSPVVINFDPNYTTFVPWNSIVPTNHTGPDFSVFAALSGNATGKILKSDIGGVTVETQAIVADNLTTVLSNYSRPIPLLNSMLSIPNYSAKVFESGATASNLSSFHIGSTDPLVNGTFIVGGYDNSRIMGNLMNWSITYDGNGRPDNSLYLTNVNIGVESGFLPLEKLSFVNGSFRRGPYKQESTSFLTGNNISKHELLDEVSVEPGSPYLHLSTYICDFLADILDLTYDTTRNLYLWSHPSDHLIFRSPVYLELVVSTDMGANDFSPNVSVKIPMALLQHTFHATTRAMNGTLLPPARYFPCARSDLLFDNRNQYIFPSQLGRAFLQAAFVASSPQYQGNVYTKYWIAQAPGPAAIEKYAEDLIETESGDILNRENVSLDANAWTNSWSSVLPIWTVDSDGVTTLNQQDAVPEGEDRAKELGIKVGVPITATVFASALLFFSIRGIKKSRAARKRIEQEIAEEDATAREIERVRLKRRGSTHEERRGRRGSTISSLNVDRTHRASRPEEASLLGTDEIED